MDLALADTPASPKVRTDVAMSAEEKKRPRKASLQPTASPPPKKQKPTIPISRGKFKNRFLRKHSSLLHNCKSDGLERPRGLIITCPVGSETRALGQIRTFLDRYLPLLFPEHKTVWTSRPHALDIDLKIVGAPDQKSGGAQEDTGRDADDSEDEINETREESADSKNDRKFQAVDAACGGVLFIRFRVDTDPVDFVVKLFGGQSYPASDINLPS
ncbi:hypothetical protein SpCBS45565_g01134 [Spizellomyces sp. 'palustris']|nr:hypothetical protein SpCBS45565_g01134 [Spizellomyces sp. 'palustris']